VQWWLTLRAVDVKGQYLRMTADEATIAKAAGGIAPGRFRWADGITWGMIDSDVTILTKTPSKTEDSAPDALEFDLTLLPEVRARRLSIPAAQRVGPVIVDRKGMPFNHYTWSDKFRQYRRAAI
jgi:hypothetical protein